MTSDEKTKIGLSAQPGRRASYMRVGSPSQIAVHATLRLPDRETAMRVERAAHKALRWCRSHGEWFRIDPRYAEGVVRLLVSGDQPGAERLARHVRRVMAIDDLWSATRSPGPFQRVDHERLARLKRLWLRAYATALRLGVPPGEWDDVLPLWPQNDESPPLQ
jgi:hypothetical protein